MPKPRILVLAGYYLPGYKAGGAMRAIANLVAGLGEELEFLILAYDRDLGDNEPYRDACYEGWQQVGGGSIRHVRPGKGASSAVHRSIVQTSHDVLYINSLFDPVFGATKLRSTSAPVLLAPHGQVNPGALRQKALKKQLFLTLVRRFGWLNRVTWHSTNESETLDIRREFPSAGRSGIEVCPYLLPKPPHLMPGRPEKRVGRLKACFISRISPKKNLRFAIESLGHVKSSISLSVYGPAEDVGYWAECERAVTELPSHVQVTFAGPIAHPRVADALANSHLFYLPTFGENFGYAIYEALCAGCPVLISDQTPWRGLSQMQAGWDLPLSCPRSFSETIDAVSAMGQEEYSTLCDGAWRAAVDHYRSSKGAETYRAVFARLANQ